MQLERREYIPGRNTHWVKQVNTEYWYNHKGLVSLNALVGRTGIRYVPSKFFSYIDVDLIYY